MNVEEVARLCVTVPYYSRTFIEGQIKPRKTEFGEAACGSWFEGGTFWIAKAVVVNRWTVTLSSKFGEVMSS